MKSVLIIPDISGWVMESIANGIIGALKHKFDFTKKFADKSMGQYVVNWDEVPRYGTVYLMLSGYLPQGLPNYSKICTSFHGGPGSEAQANILQRRGFSETMKTSFVSHQTRKRVTEYEYSSSQKFDAKVQVKKSILMEEIRKELCLSDEDKLKVTPLNHGLLNPVIENIKVRAKFTKRGFGLKKLYFTPYGVDTEFYNQKEVAKNFVCGYAGWIRYLMGNQKNHRRGHWIINAQRELNFKLHVAGGLENIGGGVNQIKEFNAQYKGVNVHAGLYNKNRIVKDFYSTISCYLVPDKYAGGPMPVLEAGAMGIPVITTDCGHCGDFIKHDEHGKVIKTYDEFLDAIRWMKEHPKERREMGKNLQEYIRENRTWEAVSPYWEKFFNGV